MTRAAYLSPSARWLLPAARRRGGYFQPIEGHRSENSHGPSAAPETFIGVDVGGTKISLGVMRVAGFEPSAAPRQGAAGAAVPASRRLARERSFQAPVLTPTVHSSQDELLALLGDLIERAIEDAGGEVAAVGLGIPSVIEFATGRARASVNVPLHDAPVRDVLAKRLGGVPIYVDNDATCAALAEAHDEQGRLDTPNLVMLTIGTGVGGGIVIDGHPYRGATGAAGELGHTIVGLDLTTGARATASRASSPFPREGSLEALGSGHALDALARAASADTQCALADLRKEPSEITGADLVAAAHAGDHRSCEALSLLGERIGVGVANVINTFDPEVVAIGGGVSAAGEALLAPAQETAWRFVLPGVGTATEIRLARSGPQAGMRGAALLASIELGPGYPRPTRL